MDIPGMSICSRFWMEAVLLVEVSVQCLELDKMHMEGMGVFRQVEELSKTFFPNLIATPFMESLHAVFYISAALCLIGAAASLLRGKRVVYGQEKH